MKKILIAIDYSLSAQKVAEQGYALGKAMNADILLIHIIEDVTYYASNSYDPVMGFGGFVNTDFLGLDIAHSVEIEAYHFLEKTKKHLQDEHIKVAVLHGSIDTILLEEAKKQSCDLIVIGTHSRKWLEEILLGSTAHKLLKHSPIPLFIIPTRSEGK